MYLKLIGIDTVRVYISYEERSLIEADLYQGNLINFLLKKGKFEKDFQTNSNHFSSVINSNQDVKFSHTLISQTSNSTFKHIFEDKNLSLIIEKGNLLDQNVDIIVNPANKGLILGGSCF